MKFIQIAHSATWEDAGPDSLGDRREYLYALREDGAVYYYDYEDMAWLPVPGDLP